MTDSRERFFEECENKLRAYFKHVKLKGKADEKEKYRLEGFMSAGPCMGFADRQELKKLMAQVHSEVFGISIEEHKLQKVKQESQEVDWSNYDVPTVQRGKNVFL